jgi:DNA-binding beta-propeller fold protein YncE/predicted outer membrane lipoprotein
MNEDRFDGLASGLGVLLSRRTLGAGAVGVLTSLAVELADARKKKKKKKKTPVGCTRSCSGKQCGSDGCGGSCGSCSGNRTCNGQGQCVCNPNCRGKTCGDDGCGGSCGSCVASEECDAFVGRCASYVYVDDFGFSGFDSFDHITKDGSGNFYATDAWDGNVVKFSSAGTRLAEWVASEPVGIASDGTNVYVTDPVGNRIRKYNASGTFQPPAIGSSGSGDGQLSVPLGIASDGTSLYVCDAGNFRIQKLSLAGAYQTQWGSEGTDPGEFDSPVGIAVAGGSVYVTDNGLDRVQKFSTTGTPQGTWGGPGTNPGQFSSPEGIAVDDAGNVLVVDVLNRRIQKFDGNGTFLAQLAMPFDDPDEQEYPVGVIADGDFIYFTAVVDEIDFMDGRVYKYRRANSAAGVGAEAKDGVTREATRKTPRRRRRNRD